MYASVTQTAEIVGVSTARIRKLLSEGRVVGAFKVGKVWVIPLFDGLPQIIKGSRGPKLSLQKRNPGAVAKIYINKIKISSNDKTGEREPVISVKHSNRKYFGHEVVINGPSRVVYRPDKALDSGAKVWIETLSPLEVIFKDFINMQDVKQFCGVR